MGKTARTASDRCVRFAAMRKSLVVLCTVIGAAALAAWGWYF
jgi:hypothetical protein